MSSSRILRALKDIANSKLGVSQFTKFCVASCRCVAPCPCFASCNCCHDPFIVRSAQTCPPFAGVTQLAHPSRCSRSTLTAVCFGAHASHRVSVFTSGFCSSIWVLQPFTRSIISFVVWDPWSVKYKSCKLAMLL